MNWFSKLFRAPELPRFEIKDTEGNTIFTRPWSCLVGRDLSNQVFINAIFSGMDLSDANFRGAKLIGCKFVGAKLRQADLTGAVLNFCDLSSADLTGARIHQADLLSTSFGDKAHRADLTRVEGLGEALIDKHELVHKGKFDTRRGRRNKDIPLSRAVRKARKEFHASQPLRPRSLLVLGDPMGPNQRYEHALVPAKWDSTGQNSRLLREHLAKRRKQEAA
jgi:hypothetical protein